jgi:hypothetical protein
MPSIVPLAAQAAQEVRVTLDGQACRVRVFAREVDVPVQEPGTIATDPPIYVTTPMVFLDLYVSDALVIGSVRCYDRSRVVRGVHLGFNGDLAFADAYGTDDPRYAEFGTRFLLLYWPAAELA